ncbi:vanadium-dependent haloperoxidase [Hymenobacter sp. BT770]|uniref:vanadium-dependent haloperoxidase n=1 Tax=Hymenobacter sp. BT770 TaxID=2886942 RepID=UPI001D1070CB|nr:vanadium-dependent haloperoxidase [Hymenobacter sp. BT770]MCC3154261.1 vanadium-dependent haloperoxidase [Hymenobacter sp. BT770]MDO3416359.1 vanadium-dependent haloperoxidase [Hymenobacter sp. BT770]
MKTTVPPSAPANHSFLRRASAVSILAVTLLFSACSPDPDPLMDPKPASPLTESYSSDVATKWADVELRLIKNGTGFSPPVAARALGYSGVTLYEAVVPGMPEYQSLAGQLTSLGALPQPEAGQLYNWNVSANAAEAFIIKNLFGNATAAQRATIDSLETALNQPYYTAAEFDRSVKFGQQVAQAVFDWSKTDGGHQGYLNNQSSSYVPPVGVGLWVQTSPGAAGMALQPNWGNNRRFVPANAALPMPGLAYTYSKQPGSAYYAQALEVYNTSRSLTAGQRVISAYWADAGKTITPPGHMVSITSIVLRDRKATLATASEAYARVGVAVADAFMGCWKCKYVYNWERPVTAIRAMIDPTWNPDWETPPFPEFVSGHATQSAATAQVLSDMFGAQTPFTDYTHQTRGPGFEPRSFANFAAFADEAAMSRLYGGIHFRNGNEVGLSEGVKVGRNVSALRFHR